MHHRQPSTQACPLARSGNNDNLVSFRFRGIMRNMRGKRLQNAADSLCQMFCGWRLIGSKPELVKLRSGILVIDAITGQSSFQGQTIDQFAIAEELRAFLQRNLEANKVPMDVLKSAQLTVQVSFSLVPWNNAAKETFYSDGIQVRTKKMNRCSMQCESKVTTDKAVYHSSQTEVQVWPVGWPSQSHQAHKNVIRTPAS